ncbi:S41 family peptidase [Clostridium sp. UBA4548]|uniref:S41 family peptidase n=1 Tax=Clostridium sp. UBA4548 TaxID=1946361 RepID=UPI0025C629D5|nr:S41 family peptidase [Clostridium sp. UBA4548]
MTVSKKIKTIIFGIFIMVLIILGVLILKDNRFSPIGQLTYEEKLQDSKYLIEVLTSIYPYFEEDKEITHKDFYNSKNNLIYKISKTKSDEEFLRNIHEILGDLYTGHGEVAALNNIMGENYYKDTKFVPITTMEYEDLYRKLDYWKKLYKDKYGFKEVIKLNSMNETNIEIINKNSNCFINPVEGKNAVLLNFSVVNPNEEKWRYEFRENMDMLNKYDSMILDFRGNNSVDGLQEILNFIVGREVKYTSYKVFAKNNYNENYLSFKSDDEFENYKNLFQKYPEEIKNKYTEDKFNVYESWKKQEYNKEKYNGKVIVLIDSEEVSPETMMFLDFIKENNLGKIIGVKNITCKTSTYDDLFLFILPRSKLPILVSNSKLVDGSGQSFTVKSIKPDIVIDFSKEKEFKIQESIAGDIGKYTSRDILFNKYIDYIEKN